jgi:hypothetical protein
LTPHGEASVARYELSVAGTTMTTAAHLSHSGLRVVREIALEDRTVKIRERVENVTAGAAQTLGGAAYAGGSGHQRSAGWDCSMT